eukprot:gene6629-8201_t
MKQIISFLIVLILLFICTVNSCSDEEYNTLKQFKAQARYWSSDNIGWDEEGPNQCCNRTGIVCNPTGNVTKITLAAGGFDIKSLIVPPSLVNLTLDCVIENIVGSFFFPQLKYLSFTNFNKIITVPQMNNLLELSILRTDIIDLFITPQVVPNIKKLISMNTDDSLGYVAGSFPLCFTNFPNLKELDLSYSYYIGDIPTNFTDSIEKLKLFGNFTKLPETLPKSIQTFECGSCSMKGEIPLSWSKYENLTNLNLESNQLEGEIPDFLIRKIIRFKAGTNKFNGTIDKFLNGLPYSEWILPENDFYGEIPDLNVRNDYIYLDFSRNHLHGTIDKSIFCAQFYKFDDNRDLFFNTSIFTSDLDNSGLCYIKDPNLIPYITPAPLSGGIITIYSPVITSKRILPHLNLHSTTTTTTTTTMNQQIVKQLQQTQQQQEIHNPYQDFKTYLGTIYCFSELIPDESRVDLDCKLLSVKGYVECNLPDSPILQENTEIFCELEHFYGGERTNLPLQYLTYTEPPKIESMTSKLLEGGSITIIGENYGKSVIPISVDLVSIFNPTDTLGCQIQQRNETFIICSVPKIKENGNIVYKGVVTINHLQSKEDPIISFNQAETRSDCYGDNGQICSGNGVCNENALCTCSKGFRGVFCDTKEDQVTVPTPTVNNGTNPQTTISHPNSTTDFFIEVIEVREYDYRSKLVKKSVPVWKQVSQSSNQYIYQSPLQPKVIPSQLRNRIQSLNNQAAAGEPTIRVTLNLYDKETNYQFANTTIKLDAGTIKYSVRVENYPFETTLGYLHVVFRVTANPSQRLQDDCVNLPSSDISNDPNLESIKWVRVERGNSNMVCKILNRAIIDDDRFIFTQFTVEKYDKNQVDILGKLPYFTKSSDIDPDFSVMMRVKDNDDDQYEKGICKGTTKNNDWKIATAVSVCGAAAIASSIGGFVFYKKRRTARRLKKNMQNKLKVVNENINS